MHYLDQGVIYHLLNQYANSNQAFEQAYLFGEDYKNKLGSEAVSTFVSPNASLYMGEVHEHILLLYYKTLNYMSLGKPMEAMVECKRINLRLQALSDKYKGKNRYKRDAFAHVLIGLLYEANEDWNNACIAYRNAYEVYQNDYRNLFGFGAPLQLQNDLLRCAYLSGLNDVVTSYEKQMGRKYVHKKNNNGTLIVFWNNGLAPVKKEVGLTFVIVPGAGGVVQFQNKDEDITLPFALSGGNANSLSGLRALRVVFPKYVERRPRYKQAYVLTGDKRYALEPAEDINAIAQKVLKQRMVWELSKTLLRVALKKAAEAAIRKENQNLGAIAGILGAATEQADTRAWYSLPHTIHYTRIELPQGKQNLKWQIGNNIDTFSTIIPRRGLAFKSISSPLVR